MRLITTTISCIYLCLSTLSCEAQKGGTNFPDTHTEFTVGRFALISGVGVGLTTASLIGLNELWYKQQPRSGFHSFNDNGEWLQMDKAGHITTSYHLGRIGYQSLCWSGVSEQKSLWYGGFTGLIYLTGIEILDGFSSQWGFSWGDQVSNLAGSALFIGQQLGWSEQRITTKFSYSHSPYAPFRPELLGSNGNEQVLKDYNGQTYWLSFNLESFAHEASGIPAWINLAIGYGGDGMLTGHPVTPEESSEMSLPALQRQRQFYLSPDIDFSKIQVKSPALKSALRLLNILKFPLPALEVTENGDIKGHWILF